MDANIEVCDYLLTALFITLVIKHQRFGRKEGRRSYHTGTRSQAMRLGERCWVPIDKLSLSCNDSQYFSGAHETAPAPELPAKKLLHRPFITGFMHRQNSRRPPKKNSGEPRKLQRAHHAKLYFQLPLLLGLLSVLASFSSFHNQLISFVSNFDQKWHRSCEAESRRVSSFHFPFFFQSGSMEIKKSKTEKANRQLVFFSCRRRGKACACKEVGFCQGC